MDTQPWDYWEAGGAKPKGRGAEIVGTLETVLKRNPNASGRDPPLHPRGRGVDAAAERALPHAERLGALMPGAGHIVHMPAHIYYRVGHVPRLARRPTSARWRSTSATSRPRRRDPIYKAAYYPHNIHFVMVSAQMGGDGATAIDAADEARRGDAGRGRQAVRDHAAGQGGAVHDACAVQPIPTRSWRCRRRPTTLVLVRDDVPLRARHRVRARRRTQPAAQTRDRRARRARTRDRLQAVRANGAFRRRRSCRPRAWSRPAGSPMPAATSTAPPRPTRTRSSIEDTLGYTEPPYWYYPVRQSLGCRAAAPGQARRRREGVPRFARARAQQRLGARRPRRDLSSARAMPQARSRRSRPSARRGSAIRRDRRSTACRRPESSDAALA